MEAGGIVDEDPDRICSCHNESDRSNIDTGKLGKENAENI